MAKQSLFSLAFGTSEITILGLLLFVNPYFFYNPISGLFKHFSVFTPDVIIPPFAKLDSLTVHSLTNHGAGCLLIETNPFVFGNDRLVKRSALKARLWLAALSAHVFAHTAFVYDLKGINKHVVGFWAAASMANFLWTLAAVRQRRPDGIPRTKATTTQLMTVLLTCIFAALWAITLMWFPRSLELGKSLASALKSTPMPDNTFPIR